MNKGILIISFALITGCQSASNEISRQISETLPLQAPNDEGIKIMSDCLDGYFSETELDDLRNILSHENVRKLIVESYANPSSEKYHHIYEEIKQYKKTDAFEKLTNGSFDAYLQEYINAYISDIQSEEE